MKRGPLVVSFILFIALCATGAYWAMQLLKPPVRAVTAPPAPRYVPNLSAAAGLFGGQAKVAVAANYQLKGVVVAGTPTESIAIVAAEGKPAQAVRAGRELVPGVTIKEVHRGYVLLTENGVEKRVELPSEAPPQAITTVPGRSQPPSRVPPRASPATPAVVGNSPQPAVPQPAAPQQPAPPPEAAPPEQGEPVPPQHQGG
jgi:general secretion pathway protein C